ncbi:MAG: LptF/LptG family permease [Chitinivibrionia bacterium]|nr:LptF/LptG family permease [Chitinivibrionia bacterium]
MIFYRYIVKEFMRPFLYSVAVIFIVFFMQLVAQILPRVLYRGVSFEIVAELLVVNMAAIISLALPMALLISSLMVFGKLSSDNEYTAMKSVGMSLFDMLPPIVSLSAIIAVLLMIFNSNILPNVNHHAAQLMSDIMRKKPAALIEPGVLIKDFQGYAIKVDSVTTGTGNLYGITIFTTQNDQIPMVSVADSGTLYLTKDEKYLELTLFSGQTISENISGESGGSEANFFKINFEKQTIFVENIDSEFTRSDLHNRGNREMANKELLDEISNYNETISNEIISFNDRLLEITERIDDAASDTSAILYMDDFSQWYSAVIARLGSRNVSEIKSEINFTKARLQRIDEYKIELNKYKMEIYKKYSLAVGAVIFVILGVPLGIIARNGSAAISVSYSLIFFIFHWTFLIGGEYLVNQGKLIPSVAMWGGNAIFALVAVWLLRKVSGYESKFNILSVFGAFADVVKKFFKITKLNLVFGFVKTLLGLFADLPRIVLKLFLSTIPAYIIGRFFSYFFVTTIGLCVITAVIDFVGNIHTFTGAKTPELVNYYLYFVASFLSMLLPISMLLSVMLSVGSFAKTNELTAIKSGGISIAKMTSPLILIGFIIAVGNFFFNETFLGNANEKLELYRNTFSARQQGRPIPTEVVEFRRNFYYFSDENTAYYFRKINTSPANGETVVRYSFENNRVKSIATSDFLEYSTEKKQWIMPNGQEKILQRDGEVLANILTQNILLDLNQPPSDMVKTIRRIEMMSWTELQKRMENAKQRGEKTQKYLADSNFKFSLPLMNVIVVLVGIAVTARSTKRGGAVHFGAGLGFVFIYWGIAQFLIVLGRNESVDPIVAAWSATALFTILGFFLYTRASR